MIFAAGAIPPFLIEVVTLIVAGAVIAYVGYRLGLVPIVGFLIAGIIIGPNGLALIEDKELVDAAAEVGVILLLFTIGIEFSLEKLARIKKLIFGGGGLQVLLATGATVGILSAFGVSWQAALFTGFLVALSSTAIVLKLLGDRGEMNSPTGQVGLGFLIFQDLAIIVMVMLVPMLSGQGGSGGEVALALGKAAALIVLVLVVARRVMPLVLERVARTCSQELFLLAIIAICFGTAYLTSLAGVSVSLGAFLAGLIVSESRFSEHAFGEIMPLQILFSATFFVSVGMLLDLNFLVMNLPLVLGVVVAVLVIKVLTTGLSALALGYGVPVATASALLLGQVGEFSFVLERVGREAGLAPAGMAEVGAQTFIAATVVLMILTPFLTGLGQRLARKLESRMEAREAAPPEPEALPEEHAHLEDHVIVAGYGRAARRLVRVMHGSGIPHLVITLSPPRADEAEAEGLPVLRGDATRRHTLEVANIDRAKLLVLADDNAEWSHRVTAVARMLNPTMRILARTRFLHDAEELEAAGIDRVIADEFESIVQLFADVLRNYGVETGEIEHHVETMRDGGYVALRETMGDGAPIVCQLTDEGRSTRTVVVRDGAPAAGEPLAVLKLGERFDIIVKALRRDGETVDDPSADVVLQPGDELTLVGDAVAFSASAGLFRMPTSEEAAEDEDETPSRTNGQRRSGLVHVYGADWCALTSGFRTYLERRGIPFSYHNVEQDAAAEDAVRAMNEGQVKFPMVVVGDREMKNPTIDELDAALADVGLLEPAD
ncbi:MAG: sodium:proton exchanger [Bacteroidetes bacterium]|jgi:CPA2 family monovalent cation:H+ antiporter-2|nr:sodium:proton exchanger [Bacteroidota bacterium]